MWRICSQPVFFGFSSFVRRHSATAACRGHAAAAAVAPGTRARRRAACGGNAGALAHPTPFVTKRGGLAARLGLTPFFLPFFLSFSLRPAASLASGAASPSAPAFAAANTRRQRSAVRYNAPTPLLDADIPFASAVGGPSPRSPAKTCAIPPRRSPQRPRPPPLRPAQRPAAAARLPAAAPRGDDGRIPCGSVTCDARASLAGLPVRHDGLEICPPSCPTCPPRHNVTLQRAGGAAGAAMPTAGGQGSTRLLAVPLGRSGKGKGGESTQGRRSTTLRNRTMTWGPGGKIFGRRKWHRIQKKNVALFALPNSTPSS